MALLALPGPAFSRLDPFSAQGVPLCGGATQIRLVRAEKPQGEGVGHEVETAAAVWDGSIVLAMFLETHRDGLSNALRLPPGAALDTVVDVGSGTGLAGLAAAALLDASATVFLTDVAAVVKGLLDNIAANADSLRAATHAAPLDWTSPAKDMAALSQTHGAALPPDLVIAADVVWVEALIQPLASTLDMLCGPETVVLLS